LKKKIILIFCLYFTRKRQRKIYWSYKTCSINHKNIQFLIQRKSTWEKRLRVVKVLESLVCCLTVSHPSKILINKTKLHKTFILSKKKTKQMKYIKTGSYLQTDPFPTPTWSLNFPLAYKNLSVLSFFPKAIFCY
jgi:hypothetical protein